MERLCVADIDRRHVEKLEQRVKEVKKYNIELTEKQINLQVNILL